MEVTLHVTGDADTDGDELAELTNRLREHLLESDVKDVRRPPASAPPGAKGVSVELAQLAVALVAPSGVQPLVAWVRAWLRRNPNASVTLERKGDTVTLTGTSTRQGTTTVDAWTRRHGSS
jgi:hypothetical protein